MAFLRGEDAVAESEEFDRIASLPRRLWDKEGLEGLCIRLTDAYRTPEGAMSLRPVQALALHDISSGTGLLGPIRVGGGKTLISLLAPLVTNAQKPILITPAGLRKKTERDRAGLLEHWRIPRHMQLISVESLGRVSGATLLEQLEPDLIVIDECHKFKNKRAGCTRRLMRYMAAHPETRVVAISGTVIKHSLKDFAHIARWALKDGAPVPDERYVDEWADALDEQVNPLRRLDPGPLLRLATSADDGDPTTRARKGFQRRLSETPGVVCSEGSDGCDASIYIRAIDYAVSETTEANFLKLRTTWCTPDDWPISEAIVHWRHARELALGFHGVWNPRPPDSWLMPRKAWSSFVRRVISSSHHLDTELAVTNEVRAGRLNSSGTWEKWVDVRESFTPHPQDVWHDDAALLACIKWMGEGPGIVWCEHKFFAKELARRTGAKYYGAGGLTRHGEYIEDADPKTCIIASMAANSTGKNLQHLYWRNLFTSPPMGADAWEQNIGRTHRSGQKADQVECDLLLGCWEQFDGWHKARADARMSADMLGQSQKILLADVTDMPTEDEIAARRGARWHKVVAKTWELPE